MCFLTGRSENVLAEGFLSAFITHSDFGRRFGEELEEKNLQRLFFLKGGLCTLHQSHPDTGRRLTQILQVD